MSLDALLKMAMEMRDLASRVIDEAHALVKEDDKSPKDESEPDDNSDEGPDEGPSDAKKAAVAIMLRKRLG